MTDGCDHPASAMARSMMVWRNFGGVGGNIATAGSSRAAMIALRAAPRVVVDKASSPDRP